VHSDVTCDAQCARKNAHLVNELVHAHGCPCICGTAPAAVAPAVAVVAAPVAAVAQDVVVAAAAEDAVAAAAEADGDAGNLVGAMNLQDLLDAELE
jgi:hypothetical protein